MRSILLPALLALVATGVKAGEAGSPQRQVLITYPSDTPDATMSEAKSAIEAAVSFFPKLS